MTDVLRGRLVEPIPDDLIAAAERAVRLCAAGDGDHVVEIAGGPTLPAGDVVRTLGLEELLP